MSFRTMFKELYNRVTGKSSTASPQATNTVQQPVSPPNPATARVPGKYMPREPYFFQIGFDFGTSSSKAVIRDINTNRAWVYTSAYGSPQSAFLLPSVVIVKEGAFMRHRDTSILYPQWGLYHLKMALEKIALGNINDSIFSEYKNILGEKSPYQPDQIATLATLYFLSSCFSEIRRSIVLRFPDYGNMQDDQMALNMAIPVAHISNSKVEALFTKILKTSWILSEQLTPTDTTAISVVGFVQLVQRIETNSGNTHCYELCHAYPEVSANVQAFVKSPASSPNASTIYFFSDTGAGTVDQSVFTYAGSKKRRLNYFSAGVYPRGSSQIELLACGSEVNESNLERWRKEKESGKNSLQLREAKRKVGTKLRSDSLKTLKETMQCLYSGAGVTPESSLAEHVTFIFSGGGHIEIPYQSEVVEAYRTLLQLKPSCEPVVTSIAQPEDLKLPENCGYWVKRLYVAYGLSFLFDELAENTFPSENQLDPAEQTSKVRPSACSCRGINKNCVRCGGTGIAS